MHPAVEKLLVRAAGEVRMLAATSPLDASAERARLVEALRAGKPTSPRWTYAPVGHDELRRGLDAAERALAAETPTPLCVAHLDRVRELAVEAALCAASGTPALAHLARERFGAPAQPVLREASATCAAWLAEPCPEPGPVLLSDDTDPRSLLSRMRAEVGRLRLPFVVVVQPSLAPLAATGDQAILVAAGRPVSEQDVERTVLHEIDGHVRPRVRARGAPLVLLRVGTARGTDDQEGRALLLEERARLLGARRRRQLAARHRAVEAMLGGATFAEVTMTLMRDHDVTAEEAVVCGERAFRGSDGMRPGLGRERVYLESFVRVRAYLAARPEDERILAAGQVSLEALEAMAPFVPVS
jgi:hypothetical protein